MKGLIRNTITIYLFLLFLACTAKAQLSVETLGAIRNHNITGRESYGVGVGLGYKFNNWVTGRVRALSYSDDDWRGGVVDEGSLLVDATLLRSANGKIQLGAIGGADRDFAADDWGFSVGLRPSINLTKNLSLFGESRIRAWFKQSKDLITTAGLNLSF